MRTVFTALFHSVKKEGKYSLRILKNTKLYHSYTQTFHYVIQGSHFDDCLCNFESYDFEFIDFTEILLEARFYLFGTKKSLEIVFEEKYKME